MHIRKLRLVARFVFPTVIALNFSFFSRIQLWLQMNHACGSTLCRYPIFPSPLPFRSIFYLCICTISPRARPHFVRKLLFHPPLSSLKIIFNVKNFYSTRGSLRLNKISNWGILYKSFARVENLRNRVIVPQERTKRMHPLPSG